MNLYIFGSGGLAKEVYSLVEEINRERNERIEIKGFLDLNNCKPIKLGNEEYPIYNQDDFFLKNEFEKNFFAIGIGNPIIINKIVKKYNHLNFPNLIHPRVIGSFKNIEMGKGNIITAGNIFTIDIKVGSFNYFNLNCTVGHDTKIGNGNIFNPGCNISGDVKIGDYNLLGTNSTILQGVEIGSKSILGAASLANKNIPNGKTHVGIPAKPLEKKIQIIL